MMISFITILLVLFFIAIICCCYKGKGKNNRDNTSDPIFIDRRLYVKRSPKGGYGVFTSEFIPSGTTIEIARTLKIESDARMYLNEIKRYDFFLNKNTTCIALGYGSIYNHDLKNNITYTNTFDGENLMIYITTRDIKSGEELCINYGINYFISNNIVML